MNLIQDIKKKRKICTYEGSNFNFHNCYYRLFF